MKGIEKLVKDYLETSIVVNDIRLSNYGLKYKPGCNSDHLLTMISRAKNASWNKEDNTYSLMCEFFAEILTEELPRICKNCKSFVKLAISKPPDQYKDHGVCCFFSGKKVPIWIEMPKKKYRKKINSTMAPGEGSNCDCFEEVK